MLEYIKNMMDSNKSWGIILSKLGDFELKKGLYSFVNPYSMLRLEKSDTIAREIDYWFIDGVSLVNVVNRQLNANIKRYSFDDTSLAPIVFERIAKSQLQLAVVGTTDEYLHRAVSRIETRYSIKVQYCRNGYFNNEKERRQAIDDIIRSQIDIVVCGMGTPHQENFIIELKQSGWQGTAFTCGGYLHQLAKKDNYYPRFFDRFNIRWLYRIIDEPHLLKRYFVYYQVFYLKFRVFFKSRG